MQLKNSVLVAALSASSAFATYTKDYKLNAYWGQSGPDTDTLGKHCESDSIDYVTLGFVNNSPENGNGTGYPGTNFAAHCAAEVYVNNNKDSKLLSSCSFIKEDIKKCQRLGKKVLLSIGGVYSSSSNYTLSSVEAGIHFADFLYQAFGPFKTGYRGPRPFDISSTERITVDGFDFDIETNFSDQQPYVQMVNHLRDLITADRQSILLTAAPQCPQSGQYFQMKTILQQARFDKIWIQFYNNPSCEAWTTGFNYDDWESFVSGGVNDAAELFIGLPGSISAVGLLGSGYITASQAKNLICSYKNKQHFGGAMLWDAYYASQNKNLAGKNYYNLVSEALKCGGCDGDVCKPVVTSSSVMTSYTTSSSTSSSTSSTVSTTSTSSSASSTSITSSSSISTSSSVPTLSSASSSSYLATSSSISSISSTSSTSSSGYLATSASSSVFSASSASSSSSTASSSSFFSTVSSSSSIVPTSSSVSSSSVSSSTTSSSSVFPTSSSYGATSSGSASATETCTDSTLSSSIATATESSTSSTAARSSTSSLITSSSTLLTIPTVSSSSYSASTTSSEDDCPPDETSSSFTESFTYSASSTDSASSTGSASSTYSVSSTYSASSGSYPTASVTASASNTVSETQSVSATSSSYPTGSASTTEYTTSTVYSTTVYTVTSCAPSVTNCPVGSVTTQTIAISTTIVPTTVETTAETETKPTTSVVASYPVVGGGNQYHEASPSKEVQTAAVSSYPVVNNPAVPSSSSSSSVSSLASPSSSTTSGAQYVSTTLAVAVYPTGKGGYNNGNTNGTVPSHSAAGQGYPVAPTTTSAGSGHTAVVCNGAGCSAATSYPAAPVVTAGSAKVASLSLGLLAVVALVL
ncbi:glycoside hydrolase superfamily [Daldinia bambusicola]|nr:glycoside hydrolase superfamily [Daldinia bambusicola]